MITDVLNQILHLGLSAHLFLEHDSIRLSCHFGDQTLPIIEIAKVVSAADAGRYTHGQLTLFDTMNAEVTLAGIADMGPMLPMLTGLEAAERARVGPVAKALLAIDGGIAQAQKLAA